MKGNAQSPIHGEQTSTKSRNSRDTGTDEEAKDSSSDESSSSTEGDEFEERHASAGSINLVAGQNALEYKSVYRLRLDSRRVFFMPSVPVKAVISAVRKDTERAIHLLNPYLYTIELEHGRFSWTVERKYTDFQKLHNHLLVSRAAQKIAAPVRKIRQRTFGEPRTTTRLFHELSAGLVESRPGDSPERGISQQNRDPYSTRTFFAEVGRQDVAATNSNSPPTANGVEGRRRRRRHKIPHFPLVPDSLVLSEHIDHRRDELEQYLTSVLERPSLRNHKEMAEFLEVSHLSFVHNLGDKWKEGLVKKRPGGRLDYRSMKRYLCEHCSKWSKRWLIAKDSFVAYTYPNTGEIRDVMLFDHDFSVRCGGASGMNDVQNVLSISNLSRELVVKCDSERAVWLWKEDITRALNGPGKQWLTINRFGSTFPVRDFSYAQWFVDGSSFMEHAANMMELAKEEIFITDWWLTPEVYLKRPAQKSDPWQLSEILKRKAEQGVRVFVLLYKELEMALGIGSAYAKRVLTGLHPKILVMRHPEHIPVPWMWAHHEKLIVVDQNIAFIGGIDLCYGRWDDHDHKLIDLGNPFLHTVEPPGPASELMVMTGGTTAAPVEGEGLTTLAPPPGAEEAGRTALDRWRSVTRRVMKQRADGELDLRRKSAPTATSTTDHKLPRYSVADIVLKYQHYLESEKMQKIKSKENTPPMGRKRRLSVTKDKLKHFLRRESVDDEIYSEYEKMLSHIEKHHEQYEMNAKGSFWIGKDYVNFILKDVVGLELPYCDLVDRKAIPRMPWHDISSVVYGEPARDAARHFVQRWNACKIEKLKKAHHIPLLMPKSYENVPIPHVFREMSHKCCAQVLRSGRSWSCGINTVEESIHQAYVNMIVNAKHYIYIENQFFISLIDSKDVRNQISRALYGRIVKAHRSGEVFRVFFLMPLLPAFEGELGEPSGAPLQTILHWTYSSISKGPNSLLARLEKEIGDPSKYIRFFALRTYADLCGRLVSEQVYIHSKLMIVDDKCALIGSANINDRSQLGERDSEVALHVEDLEFVQSTMNGQKFEAGRFAFSLRKRLFREHMGLLDGKDDAKDDIDLSDPVCDQFFDQFCHIASKNTQTFETVFKCYPSDDVQSWAELSKRKSEQLESCPAVTDRSHADQLLKNVRGYLVHFPTKFLCRENLAPQMMSKEGLAPSALFT